MYIADIVTANIIYYNMYMEYVYFINYNYDATVLYDH